MPSAGAGFPPLGANAFLPPGTGLEPPIMNVSGGAGMYPAPGIPSLFPPPMPMAPANPSLMSMGPPPGLYGPGYSSSSRGRPVRICRRRRSHRSRRCRPVIQIIESSSCSSISSCSTRSSCSRRRRRRSHSCRRDNAQQQQQPIIILPVPCQQSATAPLQNAVQQQQPQQIVLPPIQVQQPGHMQPQQLALPPIPMQQFNSSNILSSANGNPIILSNGQSLLQPSGSLPQIPNLGAIQQVQALPTQYVHAGQPITTTSASPLQYVSSQTRSTTAPQRVLVNSTNKKQSTRSKPVARSASVRTIPQNDLKYGRRPFDWYESKKKNNVINENIQIGQRGSTNPT